MSIVAARRSGLDWHNGAMQPIADLYSVFPEKFGIPRQSGQVPAATGEVILRPEFARPEAVRGLEACSHIWILFLCHQAHGWRPTVRPPRLGGNQRLGVFASRSPFRPNPIGLSVLQLHDIDTHQGVRLAVGGVDILDATPVLDIKPYLPWADAIPDARGGFADQAPQRVTVTFSAQADRQLTPEDPRRALIEQVLGLDPRPAYHRDPERRYVNAVADLEIHWRVDDDTVWVEKIV